MAKHMNIDDKRDHLLWHAVVPRFEQREFPGVEGDYPYMLDPFFDWLNDTSRPGTYTCVYKIDKSVSYAPKRGKTVVTGYVVNEVTLFISDRRVAFEFKLRFG